MQSQIMAAPSLVLAGNYSAEHLFTSLDAFLESPMWRSREACEQDRSEQLTATAGNTAVAAQQYSATAEQAEQSDVRLHLDLRRCTREHRLGDALQLVHYLSGRVGRLDITVDSEAQAGFGEVLTVIGKSHGLAVSVQ